MKGGEGEGRGGGGEGRREGLKGRARTGKVSDEKVEGRVQRGGKGV